LNRRKECLQDYCFSAGAGTAQYSDWLGAGRSEDRIPVRDEFSAPGPGAHSASCKMGIGSIFRG